MRVSTIIVVLTIAGRIWCQDLDLTTLNEAPKFTFQSIETKNIIVEFDNNQFNGKFGLVVTGENGYDYGTYYRPSDFDVTRGTLKDITELLNDYDAFILSKPGYADKRAENIQYFDNWINVVYLFDSKEDHTLYILEKNNLYKIGEIKAREINKNKATIIPDSLINPSKLTGNTTYVFIPSSIDINGYRKIHSGVNGAIQLTTDIGSITKICFQLKGTPFAAPQDYNYSPENAYCRYAPRQKIAYYYNKDNSVDLLWLDSEISDIHHTRIFQDFSYSTEKLPLSLGLLGGFVKDPSNNLYYITFGPKRNRIKLAIVKLDKNGKEEYTTYLPTGESDLNFADLGVGTSRLAYGYGIIGFALEKVRYDGHQDCNLVLINADNGRIQQNVGNICSHSFDCRIFFNGRSFISANLGDNYPRGIQIGNTALSGSIVKRTVFTYKTQHSTTSRGNLGPGLWSNDSNTYTELGNIAQSDNGYVIVFAAEKGTKNNQATGNLNESRNIGLVHVTDNFCLQMQEELIVTEDIVISDGDSSDEFYFYTYGGEKIRQRNHGVVWITQYHDMKNENASRVNMIRTGEDLYFVAWEKWTSTKYTESFCVVIDKNGKKQTSIVSLGNVRLPKGYDLFLYNGNPAWFIGNSQDKIMELFIFNLQETYKNENLGSITYNPDVYILEPLINLRQSFFDNNFAILDYKQGNIKEQEAFYFSVKAPSDKKLRCSLSENSIQDKNIVTLDINEDVYTLNVTPTRKGFYELYLWSVDDDWTCIGSITLSAMRDIQ